MAPELIVVERAPPSPAMDGAVPRGAVRLTVEAGLGHYAAVNRAVAAATGEWVLVLTARERLVGDMVLSECLNWMRKTEAGVVAGEAACDDGRILKLAARPNPIAGEFLPEPATFYRRSLFVENGGFDPGLPLAAAYEFHLRLWKSRIRFKPIPLRVVASARPPAGATAVWAAWREERRVRHGYFSAARCLWWDARALLRLARGRLAVPRRHHH